MAALACSATPPAQRPYLVAQGEPPSGAERYCAWYGDVRGDVLYFGAAAFWEAMRAHGDQRTPVGHPTRATGNTMTPEQMEVLARVRTELAYAVKNQDYEPAHLAADELLCDLLVALGLEDIVEMYEEVGKYYA